jgi:hypothetical protein
MLTTILILMWNIGLAVIFILEVSLSYATSDSKNIGLNKKCTFPEPNYLLTTDSGDRHQLTDGLYADESLAGRKAAVGWQGFGPVPIVIDLERIESVSGVSLRAVHISPQANFQLESIFIFVSDNATSWYYAGDLTEVSGSIFGPDQNKPYAQNFTCNAYQAYGRYVKFLIMPAGRYVAVDEIEVFAGKSEWMDRVFRGTPIVDVALFVKNLTCEKLLKKHLADELAFVGHDIADGLPTMAKKAVFQQQVDQLINSINQLRIDVYEQFMAVVPMHPVEQKIMALQARVWEAEGKEPLRLWQTHRWDPLHPLQEPEPSGDTRVSFDIKLMNNEVRADVLNLTSADGYRRTATVNITGLPGGPNPPYIQLFHSLSTGSRRGGTVTAALEPITRDSSGYVIDLQPGMTTQLWISCRPRFVKPGVHHGTLTVGFVSGRTAVIPFKLTVSALQFPEKLRLKTSGWDYTDLKESAKPFNAITNLNRQALVSMLQDYAVNTTWATAKVMPPYQYGDKIPYGHPPSTTLFDEWVGLWPKADLYLIYLRPFRSFGDIQPDRPNFKTAMKDWGGFWVAHIREMGLDPNKFAICIIDEPNTSEQFRLVSSWANAIKQAAPEFGIFENPHFQGTIGEIEALSDVDILAAHRRYWLRNGNGFRSSFGRLLQSDCQFWFYSPDRHPRSLDPYTYYLGQAWHAFHENATGSAFWSFSDMQQTPTWNEYAADENGPFSPLFIAHGKVTRSKFMEAVREGAQDFEYLCLLQDAISTLENAKAASVGLSSAKQTLARACGRVLKEMHADDYYTWNVRRDRHTADRVRLDLLRHLELLEALIQVPEP